MKKPFIVANWKCNPTTLVEAKKLFNSIAKGIKNACSEQDRRVEVVICPPFPYLSCSMFHVSCFKLGSQDCFWEEKGAFTGEVSPRMLKDIGVEYVIIGHSERRRYLGETDEMVNKKLRAVLAAGLNPILCVGSMKKEKEGDFEIKSQLKKALLGMKKTDIKNIVFVYEPIWAISTTKGSVVATPENTRRGATLIKETLAELFDKSVKVKVIYGGSVDSANIQGFIKDANMDGVLIGAASLRPDDFIAAVKRVDFISKTC